MNKSSDLFHSRENILHLYIILMSLITIAGVLGNILVIAVVTLFSNMQSITNIQIFSLAVADLLHLLAVPQLILTIKGHSFIPSTVACIVYCFISHVNWFAGTLTLTTMSGDRFLAVIYPLESSRFRIRKNAVIAIVIVWITATILMTPTFVNATLEYRNNSKIICIQKWPTSSAGIALLPTISYTFFFGFALPSCLILSFYSAILIKLRQLRRRTNMKSHTSRSSNKTTMLVLVIVISFLLCNLPYWINQWRMIISYRFMFNKQEIVRDLINRQLYNHTLVEQYFSFIKKNQNSIGFAGIMTTHFSQMTGLLNSALNPILYSFLSVQFRASFAAILTGKCTGSENAGPDARSTVRGLSTKLKTRHAPSAVHDIRNNHVTDCKEVVPFELLDTTV